MRFDYDVFFSYRHRPLDGEITQKTFNAIESYRLPKALREKGFADIRRAFRDTEELPVSRILTDTIDKALHSTNCLVVVCSTDTPSSEWIDREVQTFIELGRADHIYPLLITGDPEQSFPPSLKLVPDVADRVMDIRTPGNRVKKMMAREETELLRVISGIVGCKEAELLREHKLRKNRRLAVRAISAAAVFAMIAGVSLGLMNLAQSYRSTAQQHEEASMRILSELTYGLPDHLTNIPGAYSRIAGILEQNTRDIEGILRLSADDGKAAFEAAANYEKLANASAVLGEYDRALHAEDEAISIYRSLMDTGEPGAEAALASADNNRGSILNAAGRYEEAGEAFTVAVGRLRDKEDADPITLAQIVYNAGSNAVDLGDAEQAAACFEEGLRLLEPLPESYEQLELTARARYNYGLLYYRIGRYGEARELLTAASADYEKLCAEVDSLQNRDGYVQALSVLAACLTDGGEFEAADICYDRAIAAAEELASDDENTGYSRNLANLYNNRAISANTQGLFSEADELYGQAEKLYREISERTGAVADRTSYALTLINRGENAFKLGEQARSRKNFEAGLAVYQAVLPELGDYDRSMAAAWQSYYELIHLRDYSAALDTALEGVRLQPNSVLANLILGYACLYNGYNDDAENLLLQVAGLGGGQAEMILRDLDAQQRAGLRSEYAESIMETLRSNCFVPEAEY